MGWPRRPVAAMMQTMSFRLPRTTPSAAGVDPAGVDAFLTAAADAGLELHSLMIMRDGRVAVEGWWWPYTCDGIALVYSLSKAFTTTAVGIAVGEGLLDVDAPLTDALGDLVPRDAADWVHGARLSDMLTMTSGHEADTIEAMMTAAFTGGDPLRAFLQLPAQHAPGTVFTYNQGCTLALSAALAQASGERMLDWLRPRLLAPLGIESIAWTPMPAMTAPTGFGLEMGYTGAHVQTEAIVALGELWRCEGRWGSRQLVPAEYVRQARSAIVANAGRMDEASDWQLGYGYQLWTSRHGYRGDGAFGQFCLVLPEQAAVVALTAQTVWMQQELDLVWEHLLPAFDPAGSGGSGGSGAPGGSYASGSGGSEADAELAQRLAGLRLQPPAGGFAPGDGLLDVDHPVTAAAHRLDRVSSVRLSRDGDVVTMTWRADGVDHVTRVGLRDWEFGELPCPWSMRPAVATAAAADADSVTVRVVYVESPHSLTVTLTRDGAAVRWTTYPLA